MRKLLLILSLLLTCVSGAWADVLPNAVVGTYAFQATTLTAGASGHTISKDGSGNVTISPNNNGSYGATSGRFNCTLVVKINVPSTTTAGVLCEIRQASANTTYSQGLYMIANRKLKTSWQAGGRQSDANAHQMDAGEHTIIYTSGDSGATVYVDGVSKLTDSGLKASGVSYKAIYIPSTYASCITEVHFFASIQNATNIASINTESSNRIHASQQSGESVTVTSGKTLVIDTDDNLSKYSFDGAVNIAVASGKTLTLDQDNISISSLTGSGTAVQSTDITTTVAGSLSDLTLQATAGTLKYTGNSLAGTTLDGVILAGSARLDLSNTVTFKNFAGNDLTASQHDYIIATANAANLILEGNCDFTHKSNGDETSYSSIAIGNTNGSITVKSGANVSCGKIWYSNDKTNAPITVESNATLTSSGAINASTITNNGTISATARLYANTITNNGTITALKLDASSVLGDGSTTTLSDASPFNDGTVTVSGDATLNLTATTATLSQAITVAASKTLTIDGCSNTVNLNVVPTFGDGSTINFENATINYPSGIHNLANYTFTSSTAKFTETGDEYKTGSFAVTDIPSGVTIKMKKYDATEYETVIPVDGTATVSHSVGVSDYAAWLDYTFNETTKATNTGTSGNVIKNAGNAGESGNNLTLDNSNGYQYTPSNSYNEDGTLKVESTPYRTVNWPTNYTVAVAGNVPDVENGCLVAFGTLAGGYLAILRGDANNKILLVKGKGQTAFETITEMTAANATELSHLVVFTKNGNTFTVYLDGVQKAQVTYSETLGSGFQIGSLHGGITNTGIERVSYMTDDTAKEKVFAKAIRVYDYVISNDQMSQLTTEFPYTSFGGKYTRTISANSNLSATDAWLNASTQGNVDVPVNAVVDEVTYYPDVEITTTAASTLTVNADMDAENITFDGTGKLTIVSDGSHNINIYGSVTANGPVSVNYDEIDLTAVPLTIGESGSVEFDFSDHDFSSYTQTSITTTPVTGNASDYGDKVVPVYPSSDTYDFSFAYNSENYRYELTVTPKLIAKKQEAIDIVSPYEEYIGTGVGKYTVHLDETDYTDYGAFEDAVTGWTTLDNYDEPTITLNEPATGKFYRFHIGDDYMCNVADENVRTTTTTANDASTIFYLDENNYLMAYADGYGFNYGYCKATAPGIFNSFDFSESSTKCKYLVHSNPGTESNAYSNRYITTVSDSKLGQGQGEWTIVEVTSLPVTITSVGWATTCLPVAVAIPDGVTAFRAAIDGSVVNLTSIDGAIPATEPVVLKGAVGNYDFEITTAGDKGTTDLQGTTATVAVEELPTGYNYYTLRKTNGVDRAGFYQKDEGNIQGFRAYLKVSKSSGVREFIIQEPDDTVTGIDSVFGVKVNVENCYDLQGRRVVAPKRGLYIVNGKKVMF